MSKFQKLCVAFFFVCVLACGGAPTTNQPSSSPAAPQSAAQPVEAVKVSAGQLSRDYEDNELAADKKYKDKTLAVTGKVSSINEMFGQTSVVLVGMDDLSRTVTGFFADDQKESLMKLKKGQTATIEGRCDGKALGVTLKDCKVK